MNSRLRKAQPTDYGEVNDLETSLVRFASDRRASFDAVLASPDHDLVVAEAHGAVVGFAHLLSYHDLSHGTLAGELLGLMVREDCRRQGIGTALLREVCRLAEQRGIVEFHINVEVANKIAQRLYRRLGAEVVGLQMELNVQTKTALGRL